MSEESNLPAPASDEKGAEVGDTRYVGFCDILGFSNRILTDFDGTVEIYKGFGDVLTSVPAVKGVEITVYSDAVLVTAQAPAGGAPFAALGRVAGAIQNLWFLALANDLMIRGAITKGRYWEQRHGNHMFVASDALVRAVKLERSVGVPAVVIADDIEIPDEFWLHRFANGLYVAPILHFRDRNIVNPFNLMWCRSAGDRARRLMADSPAHQDKYLWFLALHQAVTSGQELVPPAVMERLVRDGILVRKVPEASQPQKQ